MKGYQTLFMLLLTLAVGALFLIRIPAPQGDQIMEMETLIANQQATITFLEQQPTFPSTVTPILTQDSTTFSNTTTNVIPTTIPTPFVQPAPIPQDTGSRVVSVDASRSVAPSGCASEPDTQFSSTDTIYGVATLANMASGDTLHVEFFYDTGGTLIYEETFTVQEPGSFCRWYVIEPDSLGWEAGTYSISYQVNDTPPVTITYTVSGDANLGAESAPIEEGDAMDDSMMEEEE